MIELIQHAVDDGAVIGPYNKMDDIPLKLNKDIISKDLNKLREMGKNPVSRIDKTNIDALIKYLSKLEKIVSNEDFELAWGVENGLPVSYPFPLVTEKAYGVYTANYIELEENEKLVEIDLHNLADLIAYSFMSRDLDETHDSIEKLLKDCGIVGFQDYSILANHFKENGDKPYEFSKTFKIGDTPYYSYENKEICDYFHTRTFKTKHYKDVVDYSCRYAATIIMGSILENSVHCGINVKPIVINTTNITFIANTDNELDIKNKLLDEISIRVFGRRFKVDTPIEIF